MLMSLNKYTQLSYEERVIIENRLKKQNSIKILFVKMYLKRHWCRITHIDSQLLQHQDT